jgi:prepilin-type N-terminal cleavage/methylation domain-containing protein
MNYELKKHAFTIAEMLVALAVMGILLTAVAIAFNASAINYNENHDMFNALNSGRQAMMRMTSQLRTADVVYPVSSSKVGFKSGSTILAFKLVGDTLYLESSADVDRTLCKNVSAINFSATAKSVQMLMTIEIIREDGHKHSQTITSAVVLRKAL